MKEYRILFLVGQDRPGIVDEVSTLLFNNSANIEDSRMAAMGGRFSITILFSCDSERLPAVEAGLEELGRLGFETSLHDAEDPNKVPRRAELPLKLEVTAMDHPGIVKQVVSVLHRNNVNIQSLNTQITNAPLSGAPLFDLSLEATVPAEKPIAGIKEELLELAADMNLDLNFVK